MQSNSDPTRTNLDNSLSKLAIKAMIIWIQQATTHIKVGPEITTTFISYNTEIAAKINYYKNYRSLIYNNSSEFIIVAEG